MMTSDQKQFVDYMTDGARTHEEWLSIMQFGMVTLLKDQAALVELVFTEAQRQVERVGGKPEQVVSEAHGIFEELGLHVAQVALQ